MNYPPICVDSAALIPEQSVLNLVTIELSRLSRAASSVLTRVVNEVLALALAASSVLNLVVRDVAALARAASSVLTRVVNEVVALALVTLSSDESRVSSEMHELTIAGILR